MDDEGNPKSESHETAFAQGRFEGIVTAKLDGLMAIMTKVQLDQAKSEARMEGKVEKAEYNKLVEKVDGLQRMSYIGMGVLAAVEFFLKVFNK